MVHAEIITIGDEILIGQIVDSNSAYIAQQLNTIGISVNQITSISDTSVAILQTLDEASRRAKVVVVTGGLGPTKDDVTKQSICDYFQDHLVQNVAVLSHIETLFKKYINTPISDLNRAQALVPSTARVLHNAFGTAPGLLMQQKEVYYFFLPGVPFEMKNLMINAIIPILKQEVKGGVILHKTLITYGLGESAIAERIAHWENALPPDLKLAYLPSLGSVRLRLTAKGNNRKALVRLLDQTLITLKPYLSDILYGDDAEKSIEENLGSLLINKGLTIGTAESLTGGRVAQQLTAVPGASNYFKGSVVAYATDIKVSQLGVTEESIATHSVVSESVARQMAMGLRRSFSTDIAVATTGVAGPTKGDTDAEIGTVYIAIATPLEVVTKKYQLGNHRERVIEKAVNKALELAFEVIAKL